MKRAGLLIGALLAMAALDGGAAQAANMCSAGKLTCATRMPEGGYCECTSANGQTEGGTVVASQPSPKQPVNATGGGCGAPNAPPGCK